MSVLYLLSMGILGIALVGCIVLAVMGLKDKDSGMKIGGVVCGVIVLMVVFVFSAFMLFGTVGSGKVGVMTTFGKVNLENTKSEGLFMKPPIVSVHKMSIKRRSITRNAAREEEGTGNEVVALSKNDVRLTMDVEFPFQLNPEFAPHVYRYIGRNDKAYVASLLYPSASKAIRDGVAQYTDSEAYKEKRDELNRTVTRLFASAIVDQLAGTVGFDKMDREVLATVIRVLPVQITRVEPPDKVLNAIEEKVAALQDLARQKTLTLIAEEEALRRKNEGTGITNFLAALPEGVSVPNAIALLNATANMTRAKAQMRAVEEGNVPMIFTGGNINVAVPLPATP